MSKYTEIFKLKEMLEKASIEHEFHDRCYEHPFTFLGLPIYACEKYQIILKKEDGERLVSVIQGDNTFGGDENLLEIMGLLTEKEKAENSEVVGWLTTEEVFERIKKAIKEGCE